MGGTSRYSKNTNRERGKIKDEYDCLKCGRQHSRGKCFAFGKRCNKCDKIGHFAIGCRRYKTNTNNNDKYKKASIHEMYNDSSNTDNKELFISSIELEKESISKIDEIDVDINLRNEFINKNLSIFERERQVSFEHKTQLKENYKAVKRRRLPNVVKEKQFVTKNYYYKTARDKSNFAKNKNILLKVRKEDKWVPGKIIDTHQTPRSYIVKEQNESVYRRNYSFPRHSNLDSYNKNTNSSEWQKKHQENVDYKCDKNSSMAQSNSSSVVSTKSGRIVKKPSWSSDYC
ncbi:hypothetical protein ILUMI_21516 [Ignelater luminosus]|uniref:CCHC-type domain-containing protein n=1 Tax=Ignelater luminosus TaxID=2038154 RepID=A0A8K0G3H8_IGNLU|nr:hypothetical protein ILUMI_21516 [Ignelater luminosus]